MVLKATKDRWVRLSKRSGKELSEHQEQCNLCDWIHETYPDLLFYAIPNGGVRTEGAREKLKREGLLKGVPDLCFPELNLYIEMKRAKGGSLSVFQKETIARLQAIGCRVEVCKGFVEARQVLSEACLSRSKTPRRAAKATKE